MKKGEASRTWTKHLALASSGDTACSTPSLDATYSTADVGGKGKLGN